MTSKLLSELNAEHFKNAVIILDIDGAIVPDKTSDISAAAERFVKLLAETNEVHLVSNGKRHERNAKLAHRLGFIYLKIKAAVLSSLSETNFSRTASWPCA